MTLKSPRFLARIQAELRRFQVDPPPGVSCWLDDQYNEDRLDRLVAEIRGPPDSPFVSGIFTLDIELNDRYPMEPPMVRFRTRIYHPNIDEAGRICLSLLKMPPKGTWSPASNLATLLISIRLLMANPNPEDPLLADVAHEYINQQTVYTQKATEFTQKYAIKSASVCTNINGSIDNDGTKCTKTEHNQSAEIAVELNETKENITTTNATNDISSASVTNSLSLTVIDNGHRDIDHSVNVVTTNNEDKPTEIGAGKRPLSAIEVTTSKTSKPFNARMKLLKTNRNLHTADISTAPPNSTIADSIERSTRERKQLAQLLKTLQATPARIKGTNNNCNPSKPIVKSTNRFTSVRSSGKKVMVMQTTSPFFATTTCKSLKETNENIPVNSSNNESSQHATNKSTTISTTESIINRRKLLKLNNTTSSPSSLQ